MVAFNQAYCDLKNEVADKKTASGIFSCRNRESVIDNGRLTRTGIGENRLFDYETASGSRFAQVVEELSEDVGMNLVVDKAYTFGLDLISIDQALPPEAPVAFETFYFLYDGLGTVRALTDVNESVTDTYTYDAFGTILTQTGATPNTFLFTGEQFDSDLGMYYLRARYMNPDSGRFWNMDTFEGILQDPLSLHKYLYAANNPVSNIDPSGKQTLVGTINVTGIISIIVKVAVVSAIFAISKAVIKDFDQVTDAVKDIARRIRKSKCSGIIGETWERVLWAKANRYRLSEILPDFIALGIPQDQWVSVNRTWIRNLKRRGCVIIDIGFDTDRDAVNIGRGQYYLLELGWTAGYPNKVSDKTIPGSNHLN